MFRTQRIQSQQLGVVFRAGEPVRSLAPGTHRFLGLAQRWNQETVQVFDRLRSRFTHAEFDRLVRSSILAEHLHVIDLAQSQRAIVWVDGRVDTVLGPGVAAYWKGPRTVEVERFDVRMDLRLRHERLQAVVAHATASAWIESIEAVEQFETLLVHAGRIVEKLEPGLHAFWKGAGSVRVVHTDKRERTQEVAGQEIMTADKVTLRVNLVVTFQTVDAAKAINTVSDADQAVYREAQLALRAAVGTRTLDQLLADKESVGGEVRGVLTARVADFGVAVRSVGLRDIILPGEMKAILNQVIEAQKRAEADLIKRREETASARSQANTAKLLAENPVLARVKELELLQGVLAGTKATFVFGPGDIAAQVRSLAADAHRRDGA